MKLAKSLFKDFIKLMKSTFGFIISFVLLVQGFLTKKPTVKKILYTLILLAIFRIGATISIPGVKANSEAMTDNSFIGMLDMIGGGALTNLSIFALGISPYITASIIMTLLQSDLFPALQRLGQSGPAGKRKINIITRVLTLIFAWLQGATIILQMTGEQGGGLISMDPRFAGNFYRWVLLPIILIAGSMFTLFIGEQITNNGIGNGTSLIIFSGIAAQLPGKFRIAYLELTAAQAGTSAFLGIMKFSLYIIGFLASILVIVYFHKAERHIPTQQMGSGLTTDSKQISRLPIKLNPAGVMPIIFAMTLVLLPLTIIQFFHHQNSFRVWMQENWSLTSPIGLLVFGAVTFLFTLVMGLVTFDPVKIAENFKKSGTFIPGIKPGQETETYITGVVTRLSIFSGFYLVALSMMEYIQQIAGMSSSISFGGTSLIILVTVGIETIEQLSARNQTQTIAKKRKAASAAVNSETTQNSGGLIW